MSHLVPVTDELYEHIAALAAQRGDTVEGVVEALLARGVEAADKGAPAEAHALDWQTASAEEIVAAIRAGRVERERVAAARVSIEREGSDAEPTTS
jgi:hypothetical protein